MREGAVRKEKKRPLGENYNDSILFLESQDAE